MIKIYLLIFQRHFLLFLTQTTKTQIYEQTLITLDQINTTSLQLAQLTIQPVTILLITTTEISPVSPM